MKINITVAGSAPFSIDVDKDINIADFKELIVHNEHFPKGIAEDTIKIIHFGKFLDDPVKTLDEYKIAENARIIIYINRKPASQPAGNPQQKTVAQQNAGSSPNENNTANASAPASSTAPVPESADKPQQDSGASQSSSSLVNRPIVPPAASPSSSSTTTTTTTAPASAPAPALPPVDAHKLQQMLMMGFEENN